MASEFRISVDLSPLISAAQQAVDEQVLPLVNQAVRAIAQTTQTRWMEAVARAKLWDGERSAYMESIQMQMTGPFSALVWSDYKYAEEIEEGRPARDLKRMLNTSPKVRATKDGRRYLVIPFRHNTPGNESHAAAMPQHIYDEAKELKPSKIVGQMRRQSGLGAMDVKTRTHLTVNQNVYQWGARLKTPEKRYSNMYRFDAKTPGGGRYSTYMTFRTMMEGSNGWIVPAQPGMHIAQQVAEEMRPLAEAAFTEAVKRTLG